MNIKDTSINFGTASQFMNAPIPSKNGNRAKLTLGDVINHFKTSIHTLQPKKNTVSESPIDVLTYYKLMNESNIISMYYQTLIKDLHRLMHKYSSWSNVPDLYKTVELDNVHAHLSKIAKFKWSTLKNYSYYNLGDKLHLKRFIIAKVENNKLDYRSQRQLKKIINKNRLYKAQIHGKRCVIVKAHIYDILTIFKSILKSLCKLNSLLGNNKAL